MTTNLELTICTVFPSCCNGSACMVSKLSAKLKLPLLDLIAGYSYNSIAPTQGKMII